AGWPFRARYPRGLVFAFARPVGVDAAQTFLVAWRDFMGPKMRTVCTMLGGPAVYGRGAAQPLASVACVEAPYASGIGYTDASPTDGVEPSPETLVHGAADAMLTAVKRLDGRPARLVLVIESAERHRKLGAAFAEEWTAMRGVLEDRTPCVGWLAGHVAAFGRRGSSRRTARACGRERRSSGRARHGTCRRPRSRRAAPCARRSAARGSR